MTLTEMRRAKDLSLGEMARKIGISTVIMSRIERGSFALTDEEALKIAEALGVNVEEIRASLPTKEEADADFARVNDCILAMGKCREHAKAAGFKKGHGGQGQMECPVCKGTLRYSVASVNGHLWGACSNADCVRWMQ